MSVTLFVSCASYQPPGESSLPEQAQQESQVAVTTTPHKPQRETSQTSPGMCLLNILSYYKATMYLKIKIGSSLQRNKSTNHSILSLLL